MTSPSKHCKSHKHPTVTRKQDAPAGTAPMRCPRCSRWVLVPAGKGSKE